MTLAFGSTKCSQCLCFTGIRVSLNFYFKKEKTANYLLGVLTALGVKIKIPLKCGMLLSVALTPCIPLPAKGYKETVDIRM